MGSFLQTLFYRSQPLHTFTLTLGSNCCVQKAPHLHASCKNGTSKQEQNVDRRHTARLTSTRAFFALDCVGAMRGQAVATCNNVARQKRRAASGSS